MEDSRGTLVFSKKAANDDLQPVPGRPVDDDPRPVARSVYGRDIWLKNRDVALILTRAAI